MTDFQRGEVARLESQIVSFHKRWDSLEAEEMECKSALTALRAERDALKQRVDQLEMYQRVGRGSASDSDPDLRQRLVCAALTGVCADPNMNDPDITRFAGDIADAAVAIADATLAAMRKGEADGK